MSLGLGIFLSVLVLIVAWQIDKRGAWRKLGRVSLWIVGSILVGGLTIGGGWWGWQTYSEQRKNAREVELIRSGKIDSYLGVKLGATKDELLYLKGEPKERANDGDAWVYEFESDDKSGIAAAKVFFFGKSERVRQIMCIGRYSWDCDALAGVDIGTDEAEMLSSLGTPNRPPATEKGLRRFRFGPDSKTWNAAVGLEKGKVTQIVVNAKEFDEEVLTPSDTPRSPD